MRLAQLPLIVAIPLVVTGCTCSKKSAPAQAEASTSADTASAVADAAPKGPEHLRFSAPIAASHTATGDVVVAGLDGAAKAIVAEQLKTDGGLVWSGEVLRGVAYSPDATVQVHTFGRQVLAQWRGALDGRSGSHGVLLDDHGARVGAPFPLGTPSCKTDRGFAWVDPSEGMQRLVLRTFDGTAFRDEKSGPLSDELLLACGRNTVFAVIAGEEKGATTATALGADAGTLKVPDDVLALSDDRPFAFTSGDDLGIVRVLADGSLTVLLANGPSMPSHKLPKGLIPDDDDVVAVDADAKSVVVVHTRAEEQPCPGGSAAASVRAVVVDRRTFAVETKVLSAGECGLDVGPFYVGATKQGLVVSWVERRPKAGGAPIAGIAFRAIASATAPTRIAQGADQVADAGCDETRCYAVFLVREGDGMKPESVRLVTYP